MILERRGRAPLKQPPEGSELPSATLGSSGQVYVTLTAAERYADYQRIPIEEARRELTESLLNAQLKDPGPPEYWRVRSRTTQLDISARVARERDLLVVLTINVRPYR